MLTNNTVTGGPACNGKLTDKNMNENEKRYKTTFSPGTAPFRLG